MQRVTCNEGIVLQMSCRACPGIFADKYILLATIAVSYYYSCVVWRKTPGWGPG